MAKRAASCLIDLTKEEDEATGPIDQCTICTERIVTPVLYECCAQRCCLECYRGILRNSHTESCPFCRREEPVVEIGELHLFYRSVPSRAGPRGEILVSVFTPVSALHEAIRETEAWQRSKKVRKLPSLVICHQQQKLSGNALLLELSIRTNDILEIVF